MVGTLLIEGVNGTRSVTAYAGGVDRTRAKTVPARGENPRAAESIRLQLEI
jgi:hypothetical protein